MNRPLYFSMGLARTFTRPAKLPMGSAVARDPYAKGGWWKILLMLVLAAGIALGVCWKVKVGPFAPKKDPCAAEKAGAEKKASADEKAPAADEKTPVPEAGTAPEFPTAENRPAVSFRSYAVVVPEPSND